MVKIISTFLLLSAWLSSSWAVEVGTLAPGCDSRLVDSNHTLDIQSYLGKVVYLDFWATWCPPCKKSMPFLNALRNEFKDQGFEIIAISVDEEPGDAEKFLKQYPVDYIVALEPSGACPEKYAVRAMPSSYFIDRKGVIRSVHLGFRSRDETEIRRRVLALLDEEI